MGLGRAKARKNQTNQNCCYCSTVASIASPSITMKFWKRYELKKVTQKTIKMSSFNVNTYSGQMALHFRFRVSDLKQIMEALHLPTARTRRRRCYCDNISSCCIVLKRISSLCTWMDMEETLGMGSTAIREVFWKTTDT